MVAKLSGLQIQQLPPYMIREEGRKRYIRCDKIDELRAKLYVVDNDALLNACFDTNTDIARLILLFVMDTCFRAKWMMKHHFPSTCKSFQSILDDSFWNILCLTWKQKGCTEGDAMQLCKHVHISTNGRGIDCVTDRCIGTTQNGDIVCIISNPHHAASLQVVNYKNESLMTELSACWCWARLSVAYCILPDNRLVVQKDESTLMVSENPIGSVDPSFNFIDIPLSVQYIRKVECIPTMSATTILVTGQGSFSVFDLQSMSTLQTQCNDRVRHNPLVCVLPGDDLIACYSCNHIHICHKGEWIDDFSCQETTHVCLLSGRFIALCHMYYIRIWNVDWNDARDIHCIHADYVNTFSTSGVCKMTYEFMIRDVCYLPDTDCIAVLLPKHVQVWNYNSRGARFRGGELIRTVYTGYGEGDNVPRSHNVSMFLLPGNRLAVHSRIGGSMRVQVLCI